MFEENRPADRFPAFLRRKSVFLYVDPVFWKKSDAELLIFSQIESKMKITYGILLGGMLWMSRKY